MAKTAAMRKLKPIEICPNGHHYNAITNGDTCAVCGAKLDLTAEMTEEELDRFIRIDEKEWVCGWLICIDGRDKGKSFVIHDGKNYLGSSTLMDICIAGDRKIEKKNHAVLMYDRVSKKTWILPGESRGMIYCQEQALFEPKELAANDRIELGDSRFRFMPFCDQDYNWQEDNSAPASPGKKEAATANA